MRQIGVDYAGVDGNAPPDFAKVRKAGADFAIIRKSYILHTTGGPYRLAVDPHFARDASNARASGLVVGCYGFFSFAKGAPSAAEQVAVLVSAGVTRGVDLPYCVDVEFPGRGIVDTGRTQGEAFAFLLELVAEVRRQAGVAPLIYTSHVQWHDSNGLGGPRSSDLDGCPLWCKTPYRVRAGQPVDRVVAPRLPHTGRAVDDPHEYWRVPVPWERQGWWIHQWQGDAVGFPGFSRTVDVNQFVPLSVSSRDEAGRIAWVQRHLCVIGAPLFGPLNVTGIWDEDTEHAVRAFQTTRKLPPNGVVDVATFASLCW